MNHRYYGCCCCSWYSVFNMEYFCSYSFFFISSDDDFFALSLSLPLFCPLMSCSVFSVLLSSRWKCWCFYLPFRILKQKMTWSANGHDMWYTTTTTTKPLESYQHANLNVSWSEQCFVMFAFFLKIYAPYCFCVVCSLIHSQAHIKSYAICINFWLVFSLVVSMKCIPFPMSHFSKLILLHKKSCIENCPKNCINCMHIECMAICAKNCNMK